MLKKNDEMKFFFPFLFFSPPLRASLTSLLSLLQISNFKSYFSSSEEPENVRLMKSKGCCFRFCFGCFGRGKKKRLEVREAKEKRGLAVEQQEHFAFFSPSIGISFSSEAE